MNSAAGEGVSTYLREKGFRQGNEIGYESR